MGATYHMNLLIRLRGGKNNEAYFTRRLLSDYFLELGFLRKTGIYLF